MAASAPAPAPRDADADADADGPAARISKAVTSLVDLSMSRKRRRQALTSGRGRPSDLIWPR
jgi:hypothetical protein